MRPLSLGWLGVFFAFLTGAFGLLSDYLPYQLLGALTILVAGGYTMYELRQRRRPPASDEMQLRVPSLTLGERLLPAVFFAAAALIVLSMALYTGRVIGLW